MMLRTILKIAIVLCMHAESGMCTPCAETEIMDMYCSQKVPGRNETPCLSNLTYTTFCSEDLRKEDIYPKEVRKDDKNSSSEQECSAIRRPNMTCEQNRHSAYCNISCNPGSFIHSVANEFLHIVCNSSTSYKWIQIDGSPLQENDLPVCTNGICPKKLSVVLSVEYNKKDYSKFRKLTFASDICNVTVDTKRESNKILINSIFHISDEPNAQCTKHLADFIKSKGAKSPPMHLILGFYCIEKVRRDIRLMTKTTARKPIEMKGKLDSKIEYSTGIKVTINSTTSCNPGKKPFYGICTECPAGFMLHDGKCQLCELGYNQNKTGQVKCTLRIGYRHRKKSKNDRIDILLESDDNSSVIAIATAVSGVCIGGGTIIAAVIAYCYKIKKNKNQPQKQNGNGNGNGHSRDIEELLPVRDDARRDVNSVNDSSPVQTTSMANTNSAV